MALVFDVATESVRTGTTDPHTWTHTPVGTPRAVVVTIVNGSSTPITDSVSYGGVPLTQIASGVDTATETGRAAIWFLGEGIPTGAQTVSVDLVSAVADDVQYTSITFTGAADTEIIDSDSLGEDRANPSVVLTYNGRSSIAVMALYSGLAAPSNISQVAGTTLVSDHDFGNFSGEVARQTSAGTANFTAGFTSASDDVAFVAAAVTEKLPATTVQGSFTTDSIIRRVVGGNFTSDSILLKVVSGSMESDAVLLETVSGSLTADTMLRVVVGSSLTADAVLAKTSLGSFLADAVLRKTAIDSFTSDSILRRNEIGTFTSDVIILRVEQASLTVDGILREIVSGNLPANAVLSAANTFSFTADAVIAEPNQELRTFTGDATLQSGSEYQFTANAVLSGSVSLSVDARAVLRESISETLTADATLRTIPTLGFTADSIFQRMESVGFTAEAVLTSGVSQVSGSFTADAVLAGAYTEEIVVYIEDAATLQISTDIYPTIVIFNSTDSSSIVSVEVQRT